MKTKLILAALICLPMFFFSCDKDENAELKEIALTTKQKSMVVSGNAFAFNLLQKVNEAETESENIMISPLSINYAFAMAANGAKNNTLNQILTTMDFENYSLTEFNEYFAYLMGELVDLDPKVELSIANSIWYRNTFSVLQPFLDVNQQYYNAEITALDFESPQAPGIINNWVSEATHAKITEIIDQIGPGMMMYLINAIYFYGEWKYEFDEANTTTQTFYLANGQTVEVPMMHQETDLKYYYSEEATIAELPYGQGNFVMDVMLPASGQTPTDLINILTPEKFTEWQNGMYQTEVVFSMPKFEFAFEKTMNDVLIALGMTDLFIDGVADFNGINDGGGLYVSEVKHKTYINVDEKGTEAAAVTSIGFEVTSVNPDSHIYLTLDHPFVFMIREVSTGAIIFSGVVGNPNAE